MSLLLASGIAAGIGALASSIGSGIAAGKNAKARDEENRSFSYAKNFLDSKYYQDPLSMVGNRSLIKTFDETMKDNMDALFNRSAAGGATMENKLAAMNSYNKGTSGLYSNLLQSVDARRDSVDQQKLNLEMQHSQNIQNSFYQDAQNWNNWGNTGGGALMDFGNTALLGHMKGLKIKDILG